MSKDASDDPARRPASAQDLEKEAQAIEDRPPSAAERDAQRGDPFAIASAWLAEATASEINDPNAMSLATVDADGAPNARMVLLKEIEPQPADGGRGAFVFYTNFESAKGQELAAAPRAAIVLHWKSLRRQLRARGAVTRVADAQADAYYATRPYRSRVGAWASAQSKPLASRMALAAEVAKVAARHPFSPPRPSHWGGFRIIPSEIEFWSDGAFRLHDRFQWRWEPAPGAAREDEAAPGAWRVARLSP
ncbi:MAG: pyridoxamine 5'-phosphate oxidase [Pseudomonadota bacterium]